MKVMKKVIFLMILATIVCQSSFAQRAKYEGEIVYRLRKFVDWPEKGKTYKFVIGVIGSEVDFECFQKLALKKQSHDNTPIEVRFFDCFNSIGECHLLYMSEECDVEMDQVVKMTKKDPILIVSGKDGYAELGSIINFVEEDGKLKIELNQQQASKRGLKISNQLKNLAIVI